MNSDSQTTQCIVVVVVEFSLYAGIFLFLPAAASFCTRHATNTQTMQPASHPGRKRCGSRAMRKTRDTPFGCLEPKFLSSGVTQVKIYPGTIDRQKKKLFMSLKLRVRLGVRLWKGVLCPRGFCWTKNMNERRARTGEGHCEPMYWFCFVYDERNGCESFSFIRIRRLKTNGSGSFIVVS